MIVESKVDIIIVSYAKDDYCKDLTRNCIKSIFNSEDNSIDIFNIIVVESQEGVRWENEFENVFTYDAPLPYGYHKFLNFGRKKGSSEWVALCNNDLEFTRGWFSNILKANTDNPDIISFSPYCPMTQMTYGIHPHTGLNIGYEIRKQISGWCIVHKREIYDIIGDLDERFYHWFCDNDYSMTLWEKGIKHALVTDSIVIHHEKNIGKTTERVVETNDEMYRLTTGSQSIFEDKWKKYIQ
jgi:GT2 family glycosyltransferase